MTAKSFSIYGVIKGIIMTEKSSNMSSSGVVTVSVDKRSNKKVIKRAFEELYGATVSSVRIMNTPDKKRNVKGRVGIRSGFKKALVGIGPGNTVNFNKVS